MDQKDPATYPHTHFVDSLEKPARRSLIIEWGKVPGGGGEERLSPFLPSFPFVFHESPRRFVYIYLSIYPRTPVIFYSVLTELFKQSNEFKSSSTSPSRSRLTFAKLLKKKMMTTSSAQSRHTRLPPSGLFAPIRPVAGRAGPWRDGSGFRGCC